MSKKRKTYYLEEQTIQKVKSYAHQQGISENEAFENALVIYEKFFRDASQYLPIPKSYMPILLEAVDHMIYQSKRMVETTLPDQDLNQQIRSSLNARIEYLQEIRKLIMDD